jgi:general nucleoside transport system ATP-binding protein
VAVLALETPLEFEPVPAKKPAPVAPSTAPVVLVASGLTRRFGNRLANRAIELHARAGEILVLLGDSGSGKSTLLRSLAGYDAPDRGAIFVADLKRQGALRKLVAGSIPRALARGIGFVSWPLALVDKLDGFANIVLGHESYWLPTRGSEAAHAKLQSIKDKFDIRIDTDSPIERLSTGDQFHVALLRTLYHEPHILLLDEPTAPLTPQDEASFVKSLKLIAASGVAVVVATRDTEKALAIADRIVVLRDGAKVAETAADERDLAELTSLLVGHPVVKPVLGYRATGETILELAKVDVENDDPRLRLREVSLQVRAGEIIGIAGTSGNGQETLAAVVGGVIAPSQGKVRLFGRVPRRINPALFVRVGIGRVPSDCRQHGVVPELSVAENLALEDIRTADFEHNGFLKRKAIRTHANKMLMSYGIDAPTSDARTAVLGDGDIQKLVLARVLDRNPYFILADHPTRGLDRRTCSEVHRRIATERGHGTAVLLISDDIDELLALSDWIGVLYEGRLTMPQPTRAFDRNSLGYMMGGQGSLAQDWAGWGGGT